MVIDKMLVDDVSMLLSHNIQLKGDYALFHIYKRGVGFNLDGAKEKLLELNNRLQELSNSLEMWGWVRGKKGSKEAYAAAVELLGIADKLPKTQSGEISSKADDLKEFNNIPFIKDYIEFHETEKLTTFIRNLETDRVHARYSLLKNTGRTGCSKPNMQQLPRQGGIRQLFIAKPGHTFIITDYSAIELSTLAQVCHDRFGKSIMRERINNGEDLHKYYASILYNCSIEDVTKDQRQKAKAANFGFPGGLGIETFIEFSKGYGLNLTEEDARKMKKAWFSAFPELREYLQDEGRDYTYTRTNRKRGQCRYTAQKNTPFQGLAADGAKLALYELDKANIDVVMFVHDEIVCEVPVEKVDSLLPRVEKIMIDSMRQVVPDVKIGVESQVSEVYTK